MRILRKTQKFGRRALTVDDPKVAEVPMDGVTMEKKDRRWYYSTLTDEARSFPRACSIWTFLSSRLGGDSVLRRSSTRWTTMFTSTPFMSR